MKKECPICHKLTEESKMTWVKGLNLCPECLEKRKEKKDVQESDTTRS